MVWPAEDPETTHTQTEQTIRYSAIQQSLDAVINSLQNAVLSDSPEQPSSPQDHIDQLDQQMKVMHQITRLLVWHSDEVIMQINELVTWVNEISVCSDFIQHQLDDIKFTIHNISHDIWEVLLQSHHSLSCSASPLITSKSSLDSEPLPCQFTVILSDHHISMGLSTPCVVTMPTPRQPTEQFKFNKIGYFNPHLPAEYSEGDIVTSGKSMYYHNVHLFVSQIELIAVIWGNVIAAHLHTCLQGTALAWYAAKSPLECSGLASSIMAWVQELTDQFKISPSETMKSLMQKWYTIDDVIQGRDSMIYVQAVIQHVKSAKLSSYNWVLFTWWNLNTCLQIHVPKPMFNITESQFINILNNRKETWA